MGITALVGRRVSLRALQDDDLGDIETWYGEAADAAYEERTLEELHASSLFAITRPEDEDSTGLVEYRREGDWLAIPFIALAKAYRGWGYGSEAVRVVEEWAVRAGIARRFRAEVDARNGLGLYFWLRLGYRPAAIGEFDWPSEKSLDMMPMVREPLEVRGKK